MEAMNFFLGQQDLTQLKKMFERDADPGFTIINEFPISEDTVCVRIYFESTIRMWYIIKSVEMHNAFDKRMKEIQEETIRRVEENSKKWA